MIIKIPQGTLSDYTLSGYYLDPNDYIYTKNIN